MVHFQPFFPGKGRVISHAVLNVQAGGIGAVQGIILACRKAQHLNRHNVCPRHKVGRSVGSINKPFFLIQGLLWPLLNKLPVYIQLLAGIRGDLDFFFGGQCIVHHHFLAEIYNAGIAVIFRYPIWQPAVLLFGLQRCRQALFIAIFKIKAHIRRSGTSRNNQR